MATRAEIIAELKRRGIAPPAQPASDRNAILAELQSRGVTPPEQPSPTIGEQAIGALEVAGTIGSGAIAERLGGLAGIIAQAIPGGRTGAEQVAVTQEAFTRLPRTQAGQQQLQAVGEALAPVGEFIQNVEQGIGDFVFESTDSPVLAAAALTTPTLLGEIVGLSAVKSSLRAGTRLMDNAGRPTKAFEIALDKKGLNFDNLTDEAKAAIPRVADKSFVSGKDILPSSAEKVLVTQIKSGGRDDALAGLAVVDNRLVSDKFGSEAMRQGFESGFVQSIKTATPETKSAMEKMLKITRQIKAQQRKGLDIRPGDIVGQSLSKRVRFIRDRATDAAKELDQIAADVLGGQRLNTQPVLDQLRKSLGNLDVDIPETPGALPVPNFKGSLISKDATSQGMIQDVIDLMAEGGAPDALRFHKLKRQLDIMIDFRKKSPRGLTNAGKNVLKDIRRSLNESIREVNPDYARVNDVLRKSLTALDDFDKATGAAIDIFGTGADSAIGTKMRGLMSNIQGRVNLENAVNQLDDTVKDLSNMKSQQLAISGLKRGDEKPRPTININDDIKDLVMFANAMDARFGAVAKTSFQGNIEQAINRVLNQGIAQQAIQQSAGLVVKSARKLKGINEFNAFESMNNLLKRGR